MPGGTFFGINTALRGLMAQQKAMQTTAHNIANASTEGYTRQRVVMVPTLAYPVPSMSRPGGQGWQVGTGVEVQEIRRIRDEFLDSQIRYESHTLGFWEVRRDFLQEIEEVFAEPSDTGLSTLIDQFWAAWQELAKAADSSPVRTTVVETAAALAAAFRHTYQQLETVREDINQMLEIKVTEVNSLAEQIARLNEQIRAIVGAGDRPNDLLDQRDKLLDELAKLVDFRLKPETVDVNGKQVPTGVVQVLLFDGSDYTFNIVETNASGGLVRVLEAVRGQEGDVSLYWKDNDPNDEIIVVPDPLAIKDGALRGLLDLRDTVLKTFRDELNKFVQVLAGKVNELHANGYDYNGEAVKDTEYELFFVTRDSNPPSSDNMSAANIEVNPKLREDVTKIGAASLGGGPGDGSNALAIARLQHQGIEALGGISFSDYYRNFIARLGVASHEADRMATNQKSLVDQLTSRKESISGVSIDEEMAYMIQFQRGYEAAARLMTVLDEMLDTLINRMAAH